MKFIFDKTCVDVIKEPKDKKYYNESAFFRAMRNALIKMGHNVIKKLMHKDGHLVSDDIYYIRERKGEWCIWWGSSAIRWAYKDFNDGCVTLQYNT